MIKKIYLYSFVETDLFLINHSVYNYLIKFDFAQYGKFLKNIFV